MWMECPSYLTCRLLPPLDPVVNCFQQMPVLRRSSFSGHCHSYGVGIAICWGNLITARNTWECQHWCSQGAVCSLFSLCFLYSSLCSALSCVSLSLNQAMQICFRSHLWRMFAVLEIMSWSMRIHTQTLAKCVKYAITACCRLQQRRRLL